MGPNGPNNKHSLEEHLWHVANSGILASGKTRMVSVEYSGADHHLQTAGKEEAGIGINLHERKHPNNGHQGNHSNPHFRNAIA